MSVFEAAALEGARSWPYVQARELIKRLRGQVPKKGYVLFETGYGPSGLPHIGTFAEVFRTTLVRRAYEDLTGHPTKLIVFSDDRDGLRKVPGNMPRQEMLAAHLGQPLSQIPDPFGTHESYAAHNNAALCAFLDRFGFAYTLVSSSEQYTSGAFDDALRLMLARYEQVRNLILPTLGPERRKTYSPFFPVCPETGKILQVPLVDVDVTAGTVSYEDEVGARVTVPVTGGGCKVQWKPDWGLRWYALDVDYEMAGKDLTDSMVLSGQVVRALGGAPPAGFIYELFLDENGEKISKSRGNGLSMDAWLRYGPEESLAYYMTLKPRVAKRLSLDVIPWAVDEYVRGGGAAAEPDNVHVQVNRVLGRESPEVPVRFGMLLNLSGACHAQDKATLWRFIQQNEPTACAAAHPFLDQLVSCALVYDRDVVEPQRCYRALDGQGVQALQALLKELEGLEEGDAEGLQSTVYEVGKAHGYEPLGAWFKVLYGALLGQESGPRMGSFFAFLGLEESRALVSQALERQRGEAAH